MKTPETKQFKAVATPSGKKAFEAQLAVWMNDGKNVAIAAPTLADLKVVYKQIAGSELIAEAAQKVWIIRAEK